VFQMPVHINHWKVIQVKDKRITLKNACSLRAGAEPDVTCRPQYGAPGEPPGSGLPGEEVFDDVEFVCPACCCGMYVELKEEE